MSGWLLAVHLTGIVLWLGGLFSTTRHTGVLAGRDPEEELPDDMVAFERKSYYFAVLPGFLLALGSGLYALLSNPSLFLDPNGPWGTGFHIKLTLVVLLIGVDQFYHYCMRSFHEEGTGSRAVFMMLHGFSGLLFIAILVVVALFSPHHVM